MKFTEVHEHAMAQVIELLGQDAKVSADAVYLAAVMTYSGKTQPTPTNTAKDTRFVHHTVDFAKISQAVSTMKGRRVQCRDVFFQAFGREPTPSESTQVGHQLRSLGYRMSRSNGRNLYVI